MPVTLLKYENLRSYFFKDITIFLRKNTLRKSSKWMLLMFYYTKVLTIHWVRLLRGTLIQLTLSIQKISYRIQAKQDFERSSSTK